MMFVERFSVKQSPTDVSCWWSPARRGAEPIKVKDVMYITSSLSFVQIGEKRMIDGRIKEPPNVILSVDQISKIQEHVTSSVPESVLAKTSRSIREKHTNSEEQNQQGLEKLALPLKANTMIDFLKSNLNTSQSKELNREKLIKAISVQLSDTDLLRIEQETKASKESWDAHHQFRITGRNISAILTKMNTLDV